MVGGDGAVTGSGGGGGGGGGGKGYIYRTAFTLDDLCRVRDVDFDDGFAKFVRAPDGAWQLVPYPTPTDDGTLPPLRGGAPVHLDRLRGGTLKVDTTLEGREWEAVASLMGTHVEVDGETYKRYALFRAEVAAWSGGDDWRVVPAPTRLIPSRALICPYPPGRDSVDSRLFTVDPASVKLSRRECDKGSERVASACPTALKAGISRWVFDGVVLLPTPESILESWVERAEANATEYFDRLPRVTAHALMEADDASSCAADAVAYYDAAVELSEYDTLPDVAARASDDCHATVWAVLRHQLWTGKRADTLLESHDALKQLQKTHRRAADAVVCTVC